MTDTVTVTREGPLTQIRLSRPEKLNAFNAELVESLHHAITEAAGNGTRLVVFSGAGKGFSGGFDLDGLDALSDGDMLLRFVRLEEMLQAVCHASFATLALVHGACYGAAADLVAACHRRVAAPGTRFRMPGPKFGVVLGTRRLANLVGADNARRLLLRDTAFEAEEALSTGFIQEISAQDAWPGIVAQSLDETLALSAPAYGAIAERMVTDTRDADMAALVRSTSTGSINARIKSYLESVRQARKRS